MERLYVLDDRKLSRDEKLQECDETLQELKEKVRHFIRTGEKNCHLDNAEKSAASYRSWLREALQAETTLSEILCPDREENRRRDWMRKMIPESAKDDMIQRFQEHFDAISIISQFCVLASLSREESEERKLHETYDRMSRKYDILAQIARLLYESPYSTFHNISEGLNIEIKTVENTIMSCKIFFNVRQFNEKYISLSPQGYDYVKYLPSRDKKYSKREMDRAIYDNCIKMLSALQKDEAYHSEIEDVDINRALFYHYRRTKENLNSKNYCYEDVDERDTVPGSWICIDREDEDNGRYRYSKKRTSGFQ